MVARRLELSHRWEQVEAARVPDLARLPELRWLQRYHVVPPVALAVGLLATGGPHAFLWGFLVSTVLLWHGTFVINSLAHRLGRRRYATGDESRNSLLLALITMGEGWHNNHHHYQRSVRQGFFPWQIDITYYVLVVLRALGLVWDLHPPPRAVLVSSPTSRPLATTWRVSSEERA